MVTTADLLDLQQRFDGAELAGDTATLRALIADEFLSIGPRGFVLDKNQWIDRHRQFTYQELEVDEHDVRVFGDTALVRTVQRNRATYDGAPVRVVTRVTQVWVVQHGSWRLAGIQFSPMPEEVTP